MRYHVHGHGRFYKTYAKGRSIRPANVGGVLISDAVQDQVKNQTQWECVPLGKFHLKNVDRPFEIYAVSAEGLKVPEPNLLKGKGEKVASLKSHIPLLATPLFGREKEINELISLLASKQVVTITGSGGMGKTRLSVEICKRLKSDFQDSIAFISLATLTDVTEVMPTLAAALDIKEAAGRELVNGVAALISDKKALIVLDNLEHVISAAKEIADLASQCPNIKILCTSRTPLKIKAEQIYTLHPLPMPEKADISELMKYPAIELFVDRAMQVNLDFQLTSDNAKSVVAICRRMDGLPLALELAAARIRILPPDKLLERLNRALDVLNSGSKDLLPVRHQTLRATIDWSYTLLNDSERRLFRKLSVFAGGFTLEAVEYVCFQADEDELLAMDELESLVNKGLVESLDGGQRFNLLQTINEFAREKLNDIGETDSMLQKHAEHYFEFSENLEDGITGFQQMVWMKQGALEEANIQKALEFLLERAIKGDESSREMGLLICGALWLYWHIRGKHKSAKNYINSFLDVSDDLSPSLGKCKALFTHHVAFFTLGEYEGCRDQALLYYQLAEELNNEIEMGKSSLACAFGYFVFNLEIAKKYSDESVLRFRKLREDYWLALALWNSGIMNLAGGDLSTSKERYSESLTHFEKTNDNEGKGGSYSGLAMLEVIGGNLDQAIELYLKSLSAFETIGDRPEEARILSEMSWTYLAQKKTLNAKKFALDSIQAYQEVGSMRGVGISMFGLAAIEAEEGHPKRAVEIAAAAEQFARQEGVVVEFGLNDQGKVYLENAKKELSDLEIESAEKAGRKLSLSEILQLVEFEAILID